MPTRVNGNFRHVTDERLDESRFMCSSAYIIINLRGFFIASLISH